MRTAIISDIHGNLTALEAVLSDVKGQVDGVVCLGDVAAVGPQPHETIVRLKKARFPCVMGNSDESLLKGIPEDYGHLGVPEAERRRLDALDRWTASQTTESDRNYLKTLKPTIALRLRGGSLFCYHGSPGSNSKGILPTTSDEEVSKMLGNLRATIFAGGHTHSQMIRRFGSCFVINPGSVGLPFLKDKTGRVRNPAWAEYAIIDIGPKHLNLELRQVRYNLAVLRKAVRMSGLPGPDWWLADWF